MSTPLMIVTTTSAAALATASALENVPADERVGALTLITLCAGLAMIVASVLRLGRYTRFVSHSVMTGFLTGVAVNIVLGQLPTLTGAEASGSVALTKAVSVVLHPGRIDPGTLLVGLLAIALLVGLARTRLAAYAALVAVVVPTAFVVLAGLDSVEQVADSGAIPPGMPLPAMPDFSALSLDLIGGALAVAAIVLVQGAGVAEVAPNPSGAASSMNRDFLSQGVANVAASLVRGQPVGGSLGQTALNLSVGARTRWASIFSGLWLLLILVAFARVIGIVAEPTLAALLIVAAVGSLRPRELATILRTGSTSQVAMVVTFSGTLLLPVAMAVGLGVALSLLMQLNREALDLRIVQLAPVGAGFRETAPPAALGSGEVVVLDVYGSLLYAGSRTLQRKLPNPTGSARCAVIIRLRGRTQLGATFFMVLEQYASALQVAGGRLYLSGVDPVLKAQLARNRAAAAHPNVFIVPGTEMIGESTHRTIALARRFIDGDDAGVAG